MKLNLDLINDILSNKKETKIDYNTSSQVVNIYNQNVRMYNYLD